MLGGGAKRAGVSFAGLPETPAPGAGGEGASTQLVEDILLYRNPPLTYVAAGAGVTALGVAWFALRGAHGLTFLTGASVGVQVGGRAGG